MHILAHYFHTARRTCGTCDTIFIMWIHVEKFKHEQQKIHGQVPCDTTFHMKCTYLHNIFTHYESHVDACEIN